MNLGWLLIRPEFFKSPKGWEPPFDGYVSRFGFIWWFWIPRFHTQRSNDYNPRLFRVIWLCFAVGIEFWLFQSRGRWPTATGK